MNRRWKVPSVDVFAWFAKELNQLYALSEQSHAHLPLPALTVWVYVSRNSPTADDRNSSETPGASAALLAPAIPSENFKFGKPRFDEILTISNEFHGGGAPHLVFACGPKTLVNSVWDAANLQKRKGNRFDFHHETFHW